MPRLEFAAERQITPGRRGHTRRVAIYEVLIRSGDLQMLSSRGQYSFDDPPIEGTELVWENEHWIVDDVDDRFSPPQVTLRRP